MAISRKKVKADHYFEVELDNIMRRTKARHTDMAAGRYNWSEVIQDLLRKFIAGIPPDVRARIYAAELNDMEAQLAELRERIRRDPELRDRIQEFLKPTLDEFAAANGGVKIRGKR